MGVIIPARDLALVSKAMDDGRGLAHDEKWQFSSFTLKENPGQIILVKLCKISVCNLVLVQSIRSILH